jgi:hypothetical protein
MLTLRFDSIDDVGEKGKEKDHDGGDGREALEPLQRSLLGY